jgi:hypothetical protein
MSASVAGGTKLYSGSEFTNSVTDNIRLTEFFSSLVGVGVAANNATGTYNTVLGYNAAMEGRHGDYNVVIGTRAATYMEGDKNTMIGTQVAARLIYGNQNTITGSDAAALESSGSENTLYGTLTAFGDAGVGNTCMGYRANTHALPPDSVPSQYSSAYGHNSAAAGSFATALGSACEAVGNRALAVGSRSSATAADTIVIGAGVSSGGSNSLLLKPAGPHALTYQSDVDEELNVFGVLTGRRDVGGAYAVSLASDSLALTNQVSSVRLTPSGLQLESRSNVQVLSQLVASGGLVAVGAPSAFLSPVAFHGPVSFTQAARYDVLYAREFTADTAAFSNLEVTGALRLGRGVLFPESVTLCNLLVERSATFAGAATVAAGLTIAAGDLTLAAASVLRAPRVTADLVDAQSVATASLSAIAATACNLTAARLEVTGRAVAADLAATDLSAYRASFSNATAINLTADNLTAGNLSVSLFEPQDLRVSGTASFSALSASNAAVSGSLAAAALSADLARVASITAAEAALSNLTVPGRATIADLVAPRAALSNLAVAGDAAVWGRLEAASVVVRGEAIASSLRVTGDAVFESGIRFNDSGTTSFSNLAVDALDVGSLRARHVAASNLDVIGRAAASELAAAALDVSGLASAGRLAVSGNAAVLGRLTAADATLETLTITRAVILPPGMAFSDLTVDRDLTVSRALTVEGFARLGGDALLEGSAICRSNVDALGLISAWGGLRVHGTAEFEELAIRDLSVAGDLAVAGTLCNTGDARFATLDVQDRLRAQYVDATALTVERESAFNGPALFAAPSVFNATALFNAPVIIEGDLTVDKFIANDITCNTMTVTGANTLRVYGNSFLNYISVNKTVTQRLQVVDQCDFSNTFVDGDIWVEWEANVRTLVVREGLTVSGGAVTIGSGGDLNIAGNMNLSGAFTALPGSSTLIDGDFAFGRDAVVTFHKDVSLNVASMSVGVLDAQLVSASNVEVSGALLAASVTADYGAFSNLTADHARFDVAEAGLLLADALNAARIAASNLAAASLFADNLSASNAAVSGALLAASVAASNGAFSNLTADYARLQHADANVLAATTLSAWSLAASNASISNITVLQNAVISGDLLVMGNIDGHFDVKFSFDRDTLFRASLIVNNDTSTYGNLNSYGYFNSVGTSQFWSQVSMYADMDTDHCITMYNPLDASRTSRWDICLENPDPEHHHMYADFVISSWKKTRFALTDDFETGVLNFTGKHRCSHTIRDPATAEPGMLVCCTGAYEDLDGGALPLIDEALPVVRLSGRRHDPAAFGVIASFEDARPNRTFRLANMTFTHPKVRAAGPKVELNSAGEGGILVCDQGGDLRAGDLLTTSDRPGLAMRQLKRRRGTEERDDVVRAHTVAKITCDCTFLPGESRRFVGCVYKF